MNHKIKIYWCDDEFALKVLNPVNEDYLQENGIEVQSFSKSDDLLTALNRRNIENHVDAVIFDYNMSNISDGRPERDEKSGFLEILRNMNNYIAKGIPFFLWSKMDFDYIRCSISQSSDYKKELFIFDSYFNEQGLKINGHNHKRRFTGEDFEELIDSVIREVEYNKTPQAILRCKYPEAYEAAMSVSQKCWDDIVAVLTLTPESDDWHRMEDLINPLRCHVEAFMDSLGIPSEENKVKLSALGLFISGKHDEYTVHEKLTDTTLGYGITHLMTFINDGSHQKETLTKHVRKYLIEKKDEHLLYYIAHSLINLLIWANKAQKLKEEGEIICIANIGRSPEDEYGTNSTGKNLNSITDTTSNSYDRSISGLLELDDKGYLHIGECQVLQWRVGQKYEIGKEHIKENTSRHSGYKYFTHRID